MSLHRHHIIPKHMGGGDDPSNIIEVSCEQHAELHRRLWMAFGHWQDRVAWMALDKRIDKDDIYRERSVMANLGRPKSEEQKRKQSLVMKGKPPTSGSFKKGHKLRVGMKHTVESKARMAESARQRPRVSCLACKKQDLPVNQWKQYHINRRCI